MINLINEMTKTNNEKLNLVIDNINELINMNYYATETRITQFNNGTITKEQFIQYTISRVKRIYSKELEDQINALNNIKDAGSFIDATIVLEWNKGFNCKAEIKYHWMDKEGNNRYNTVTSSLTGGYGYDKASTAISNALNQIPSLIKLMYQIKDANINTDNRELFGYGSGYGLLPYFEGGVGVSEYHKIFDTLGYRFKGIASTKGTDVYTISMQ